MGEIVEVNEATGGRRELRVCLPRERPRLIPRSDEIKTVALGRKVRPCSWLTMGK